VLLMRNFVSMATLYFRRLAVKVSVSFDYDHEVL